MTRIATIQERLARAGLYQGAVDGLLGRRTYAGLLRAVAQKDVGAHLNTLASALDASGRGAGMVAGANGAPANWLRLAHFLAQTATETGGFRALSENLNYSVAGLMATWPTRFATRAVAEDYAMQPEKLANAVYANRLGNGPPESGDGWRFRGRGLIQLTGRDNYVARARETGLPLVADPAMAADPAVSVRIACAYWLSRNIHGAADADDIVRVRRLVNGGQHGLADARIYLRRAKAILG